MPDDTSATEEATNEEALDIDDDFDKERALNTIRAQRAKEKEQAAEIARLKAIEAEVEQAKAEEAEAQKGLEQKLAEREARIEELEAQANEVSVKADFVAKAGARGYEDPQLAYLAARDAGVLGGMDPETGNVGEHDFDKLEERFPALAGEARERRGLESADAGVRGHRGKRSTADIFNTAIRESIR